MGKKGVFSEGGWVAEVIIQEDNSNTEWEKYKLEVVRTIHESTLFTTPPDGYVFSVDASRAHRSMVDWGLEISE